MSGNATVFIHRQIHYLQARLLAQSGIARAEYFFNGGDNHTFDFDTDSLKESISGYGDILLKCKQFGGYAQVTSRGRRLKKEFTIQGVMGRDIPDNIAPRITLTGHIGGLVLDHGTTVEGTIVIHHGTVKKGNNTTPVPNSEKWVLQKESPALPFDLRKIRSFIQAADTALKQAPKRQESIPGAACLNSGNDTLLKNRDTLFIQGNCEIKKIAIKDVCIVTPKEFLISEGAFCKNCLIICKSLTITGGTTSACLFFSDSTQRIMGGSHESQFIATDSIIIGSKAESKGYSLWVSYRILKRDTVRGGIFFPEKGVFQGHAVSFTDSAIAGKSPGQAIVAGDGSVFRGCYITDGDVNMKYTVLFGHIWARSIVTVKDGIGYTNWLIGCTLKQLDRPVPFPLLGELPARVWMVSE